MNGKKNSESDESKQIFIITEFKKELNGELCPSLWFMLYAWSNNSFFFTNSIVQK